VSARRLYALVGVAALLAGALLWWAMRPPAAPAPVAGIAPAALFATSFVDAEGRRQALGQFEGKLLVLNFWATWCAPCLEEMPAFVRVQSRWAGRAQFVGLSAEAPELAAAFGRKLAINYPLWTGGEDVAALSRRLGNSLGVLPHTALLGPQGQLLAMKVGPYTEDELERLLRQHAQKSG
jgi:thiol-disulfide isomerase/thioredoxin